jgi:NTE family protein
MSNGKTLFCWSGGGLAGLDIHVGILCALDEAGIHADANAGTSAGAIMAAFDSAGYTLPQIANILCTQSDADVRQARWFWKLRFMSLDSMLDPKPIKTLLGRYLPTTFEALKKPCTVFATEEDTCRSMCFSRGILIPAVMASMAIAGVFPPVKIGDTTLSDGGTTDYLPLPDGWTDYARVYLLIARRPVRYQGRGIMGRLLWNIDMLVEDQMIDTINRAKALRPDVVVIRPPVTPTWGSMRFDHSLVNDVAYLTKLQLEAK